MKLFARKPSTEPSLPPELQPYYGKPSRFTWWHQMGARSRGVLLLALALIIALIALLVWASMRNSSNTPNPSGARTGNPAASQSPQTNKSLNTEPGKPATTPLSGETTQAKPAQ